MNVGSGEEITIRELAETVARLVGYRGKVAWDASKPDGQPRRCLDVSKARELMGFESRVTLEEGLRHTIGSYRAYEAATRSLGVAGVGQ